MSPARYHLRHSAASSLLQTLERPRPPEEVVSTGASPDPGRDRRGTYGRYAGPPRRCVAHTRAMDEILRAVTALRELGALEADVSVGGTYVRVKFEPAMPAAPTVPTFEVDPEMVEAEREALLYHSS